MSKPFNWKIFFILWVAAIFGVIAVIPYTLELQRSALQNTNLPMPLSALLAIQIVQNALMFGVLIAIGLFFANRVGLGAPILEARLRRETVADKIRAMLPISVVLGIIASLLIIGLDAFVFQVPMLRELGDKTSEFSQTANPAAWKGFLASFYGGIAEEILLRLAVMSFLVWLGRFVSKTSEGQPTSAVFWVANILAAVLFGMGHLPTMATLAPLTPLIVTRTILLNGISGVIWGWLYWKRGLESAMVSHFSANIVLHVLLAL